MNSLQRKPLLPEDKSPAFAFVLTLLFSLIVIIRPQEIFTPLNGIPFIAVLSILILVIILLAHRPIQIVPQHIALLIICPHVVISGILNGWPGEGVAEAQVYLVSCVIPLFIFSTVYSSKSRQIVFMWFSLFAAMVMVHNGYTQQQSPSGYGWTGTSHVEAAHRITYLGILKDPNDLGLFFMMNIPFSIYFIKHAKFLGKLISLSLLGGLLYGIYMTNSRGAMLALAGMTALYLLITYGGTKAIILGLTLSPPAIFVASIFRTVSSQEASAMGRLWAWWDGLEMLKANPIFGVGSNNFIDYHGKVAHNTYIQVAAEIGLVGYLLWMTLLLLTLYMGFSVISKIKNIDKEKLTETMKIEGALCTTCFYSLCGFSMSAFFLTRNFFIIFYMVAGMAIASYFRFIKENNGQSLFEYKTVIKNVVFIALSVLIFIYIILKFTV
tara:strand:- start:13637 stop:14953 length:1317 start_codon:yes stop_codon:yes gene_type:complete